MSLNHLDEKLTDFNFIESQFRTSRTYDNGKLPSIFWPKQAYIRPKQIWPDKFSIHYQWKFLVSLQAIWYSNTHPNTRHCKYYTMYNHCNDTVLNSSKHKHTLTENYVHGSMVA